MHSTTITLYVYLITRYVRLINMVCSLFLIRRFRVIKLDVGLYFKPDFLCRKKHVRSLIKLIIGIKDTRKNRLYTDLPSKFKKKSKNNKSVSIGLSHRINSVVTDILNCCLDTKLFLILKIHTFYCMKTLKFVYLTSVRVVSPNLVLCCGFNIGKNRTSGLFTQLHVHLHTNPTST